MSDVMHWAQNVTACGNWGQSEGRTTVRDNVTCGDCRDVIAFDRGAFVEELRRLLHWPKATIDFPEHHAGRVRALAWVVTGQDFGREVLDRAGDVELALRLMEQYTRSGA